jgi:hypothetical protein
MRYLAGLDVSLEETAICAVDEIGGIVKETQPRMPKTAPPLSRRLEAAFARLDPAGRQRASGGWHG